MPEIEEKTLAVAEPHALEFDLADEEQIIAEIQGRVTEKYVYELKGMRNERGEPVTGLSYAGTNWAVREYAKRGEVIRVIGKPTYEVCPVDPEYVLVSVVAQRFAVQTDGEKEKREVALDTRPACKRQWRKMKKNRYENGEKVGEEIVDDPFFWEKGLSKATRNAMQALIPTDVVKELINQALKIKHSGPIRPADGKPQQARPAAAKPQKGAAAPQTAPPQKPATAPSPAASGAAAPQAGAQQGQPAPGAAAPKQGAVSKETIVQNFEVVLKQAFNTQDGKAAREHLKRLAGTDTINDMSETDLRKYGKILQGCVKGTHRISEDGTHVADAKSGEVVWGKKPEPEPAQAAAPASQAGDDEFAF